MESKEEKIESQSRRVIHARRAYTDRSSLGWLFQYTAPELAATNPDPGTVLAWVVQLGSGPLTLTRSRYTEDSLEAYIHECLRQYIILGAGLDTFAYRDPDLSDRLQILKLDHPATQTMKAGFDPLTLSADLDHIRLPLEENLDSATSKVIQIATIRLSNSTMPEPWCSKHHRPGTV